MDSKFELTNCQVKNSSDDNKLMRILAKWSKENVEMMILRCGLLPLAATVSIDSVVPFEDENEKETFLTMVKDEMNGNNEGLQFFLKDKTFYWKKSTEKFRRTKPIHLNVVEDVRAMSQLMEDYCNAGVSLKSLARDNDNLQSQCREMSMMIEDVTAKKLKMERELYCKFILLLNTKKEKIKLLENELKKNKSGGNNGFDDDTDVSDTQDSSSANNTLRRKIKEQDETAPSTSGESKVGSKKQKLNNQCKNEEESTPFIFNFMSNFIKNYDDSQ